MSETIDSEQKQAAESCSKTFTGECVGQAIDAFVASLETTITGQGWPLVVRVDKETLAQLDLLVAGGVCKSRAEGAVYLLQRGVESSQSTFDHVTEVTGRITDIQQELSDWVQTSKA